MSDKLVEAIDRLEKTISDLKGTVTELVGDMQIVRMKQAMMADRIRKISIKVKDHEKPQEVPIVGAREVQAKLAETLSVAVMSTRMMEKKQPPVRSMDMPRCTDCKHSYRRPFSPWTCTHPDIAATDPVTGLLHPAQCFRARLSDGPCGPNGKHFERETK